LKAGELLDGVGGFATYGLIENGLKAREIDALPIGLSEGKTLRRHVPKDQVIALSDVNCESDGLVASLWEEQRAHWPASTNAKKPFGQPALVGRE
jgi:predicted homoserine dehydrogenase-like protein